MTAKPTKRERTPLERLIHLTAPADVRFGLSTVKLPPELRKEYEITIASRGALEGFMGKTADEVIGEALQFIEDPDPADDPWAPSWVRLPRHAREIVEQHLREQCARHRAAASRAKLTRDEDAAHLDFMLADAYNAAIAMLDHTPTTPTGARVVESPLAAELSPAPTAKARAKPKSAKTT